MKYFLLAAVAATLMVSCSKTSYPTNPPGDPRYPDQSRRYPDQYPLPGDSRTYPTDYPRAGDQDGVVTIIRTGDQSYENLPPGQAKKKYGGQSARVYAPGQRKKNGGNNYGMATVIAVPDRYASRSNSGQLYYVYRNNTYWKQNDGYYYLQGNDSNWNNKGQGKHKHHHDDDRDDD